MDGKIEVKIHDGFGLFASIGSFAICRNTNNKYRSSEFIYCREQFHRIRPTGLILFHTRARQIRPTVAFIKMVENKLSLQERSQFYETQRKTIILMKVSPWWNEHAVRRSFLTLLIRVGKKYKSRKNNFAHVLHEGNAYLQCTKIATDRFMGGYTKLKGRFKGGWVEQFWNLSDEIVNTMLVKP